MAGLNGQDIDLEKQALTSDVGGGNGHDCLESHESTGGGAGPHSVSVTKQACKRIRINMDGGRMKQGHRCTVECLDRYPIHHAARIGRFKDLKALLEKHKCTPKGAPKPDNQQQQQEEANNQENQFNLPIITPESEHTTPPLESVSVVTCCPLERDECLGRTPLHYAASTGNVEKGLLCVKLLLTSSALTTNTATATEKLRKFVNCTDYNNETALHLAARNEATHIVKELLLNQADLDIKSYDGKCGLMEIYKKTPLAMDDAMNQSISYVEFCRRDMCDDDPEENVSKKSTSSDEIDFTHSYVNVCLNFYPLLGSAVRTGKGKNGTRPVPETTFLYKINRKRMASQVRQQILNNVLVQAFLYFKWSKIKIFCFFAIFLHVIWLSLYIGIVIDIFVVNCPYLITRSKKGEDKQDNKLSHNAPRTDWNESSTTEAYLDEFLPAELNGLDGVCELNGIVHIAAAALLIFSTGIALKELFQFIRLRSLYIRFENVGQCILLAFIFVTMPNLYLYNFTIISPLHYQISAFGIFLGWTLFLCQLSKLPRCCFKWKFFIWHGLVVLPDHGIYVEILTRVFKNFLVFITIFSSLLISFVFSFNILLPNSTGFINLSNSVLKVLTMMTGELNYDDIFHSEDEEEQLIYPVSSHVMYGIFIMVATIILFNLLIGFTVSDIQGLQKDAEVNQISNKLEQIFLMECFLLSTPMQTLFAVFGKVFMGSTQSQILRNIMVTRKTPRHTWMCYHTKIKSLPVNHRVEIRDWASKNCLPIADRSGATRSNLFQSSFTRHH